MQSNKSSVLCCGACELAGMARTADPALLASGRRTGRSRMYGGENLKLLRPGKNTPSCADGGQKGSYTLLQSSAASLCRVLRYRSCRICCVTARRLCKLAAFLGRWFIRFHRQEAKQLPQSFSVFISLFF